MRRKPLFPPPTDASGKRLRQKGRQSFTVLTVNGRVRLKRIRWQSSTGAQTPMDRWLDVAEATISQGVRELVCRLNAGSSSFAAAAENLRRAAQLKLSRETLRQVVEQEGRQVLAAQKSGALTPGWSAADCVVTEPAATSTASASTVTATPANASTANASTVTATPANASTVTAMPANASKASSSPCPSKSSASARAKTRVYFGCDGVMVPLVTDAEKRKRRATIKHKRKLRGQKAKPLPPVRPGADQAFKEFKLVVYYDDTRRHRLVEGTQGDHAAAGRLMRRQAVRLRLDLADEKVGIVDGAPWIRRQVARQNLPLDALGLDFYHLAEHVHAARRAVFGEEDEDGQRWASELLHTFKHDGYEAAWAKLLDWRGTLRGAKRQAADALLGYVGERREMIRYPEFVAKGWQLGSGPTESCCKTLTARLKGRGRRWDARNAEAVMALEALKQSGQWQAYWLIQAKIPA
ncbi:MAG: hypothetical protein KatS3mg107_1184 [Gemmataceae bacterium]|nr:MAG: hypothetical protein KatS3mg107_1184 [Gemmataceae bacterium]